MRLPASLSVSLIFLLTTFTSAAPKKEYLTDAEVDLIRDAQEIRLRVPTYLRLAEKRLVVLGLMDKSEKDREKERKDQEQYEKEKKRAGDKAARVKAPESEFLYLEDFTRTELLRGYIQVLEEVMSNIDDAYARKGDVRDSLEEFEKFSRETLPIVQKFQPKSDNERVVFEEAVEKAKEAQNGAKEALNLVPKTEKKPKKK